MRSEVSLMTMTDSLHSHNSNHRVPRKRLRLTRSRRVYPDAAVIVHLIDGTYELFRHFYGLRRFTRVKAPPHAASTVPTAQLSAFFKGCSR